MRIGERLLADRIVDPTAIEAALAAQGPGGMRVCSLLISRGVLTFDRASRALGEHLGVAALLERHLEHRDPSVVPRLPAALARGRVALPIAVRGDGTLIIGVRDPSPALERELARAAGMAIVIAIVPALALEQHVARSYPDVLDFDIDLEVPAPRPSTPPMPIIGRTTTSTRDPLDVAIASLRDADTIEWLLDIVFGYVGTRWRAAILLEVRDRRAVGVRGHGPRLARARSFVLDLEESAIVRRARDDRAVIDTASLESEDAALLAALDTDAWLAAPIDRAGVIGHVLVVGGLESGDSDDAAVDLGLLTEAMGEALARL